ncbi:MAG: chromosomal replication initiator protein DnaA [Candidatus Paceibacterota bacterium]
MITDSKQLWENVLVDIELSISPANFTTWFKNTHIAKVEDGVVFVGIPNQFVKDWLESKHHKLILKALRTAEPGVRGVEYTVSKEKPKERTKKDEPIFGTLPLSDHYINRVDNLNPRYTFDSFVVGPFNELSYAASQAIIANPGITYNPFYVYGDTGHGKTHLIQAIGNYLKKGNSTRKVYYVTSEKFTSDLVNSLQNNTIQSFKERYRQYDVLIMDDVQFLSGREKTQEELFHLFNTLYDNNKQIIFSSDKPPQQIQNLEDRLKSRFSQGMTVDVSAPDRESRVAILQKKAQDNSFILSDELAYFLAAEIEGNIRDLEGALNAVICQTQLKGETPSIIDVKQIIKNTSRPKRVVSAKEVVKKIAEFYDLEEEIIYEKTRKKEVVKPRQIIMYILREDYSASYPSIGQKLGGRDHTTVIHSCEKIKRDLKENEMLGQEIQQIRLLLK